MKYVKALVLGCLFVTVLLLPACGKHNPQEKTTETMIETKPAKDENQAYDDVTVEGMAKDVLKKMSLEEKIGQLFIVCTDSLDFYAETAITDEMKENLEKYQPGGVVLFSFNLKNRYQTSNFIKDMQSCMKVPLFIAVDEEGGAVARVANNDQMGTTSFPSMQEIGASGDPSKAALVGETIGKDIASLGFNLDFAPVADVMTNEANQEIGERSFGSDPKMVASMVSEVVKGLHKSNVCATLKHFPGQGSSGDDTHKGYVNIDASIDDLRDTDFLPFIAGMKADADLIMVSHVSVNNVTGNDVPASLSHVVISEILRNELQYDGIVITDAMNMKSITKFYDSDEAALKAFQAGNDIILMPDDFVMAADEMKEAVENGEIETSDLNKAVLRILKTKIKRGILTRDSVLFQ